MSQKKDIAFLLHPNDYNEISFNNITLVNPIDVYILSKQNFKIHQNISIKEIFKKILLLVKL